VETRNGIRIIPDRGDASWPEELRASTFPDQRLADALTQTIEAIAARYGNARQCRAVQFEYPR